MRAAIVSIGDELTLGQALNTNSAHLADAMAARSILVDEHRTVADDCQTIAAAIRDLAADHDLLILTGGLGPTIDDVTRESLGQVLAPGKALVQDEAALAALDRWFSGRGRQMPQSNLSQTLRPITMRCIENENGTAPGLAGRLGQCAIYALPGPPSEMMPMFQDRVVPELDELRSQHGSTEDASDTAMVTGKVNLFGLGESLAAERIADLMNRDRTPLVGITLSQGIISARVRAHGPRDQTQAQVQADLEEIEKRWHPYAFGRDDDSLSQVLGHLLTKAGQSLATAESCTGGWLGKSIVDVPGSSAYYLGGWITYSNAMKTSCLGVSQAVIETCGAVSGEVARSMAEGARDQAGADMSLAITGVAGPEGTPAKPAGLVFIAIASANQETGVREFRFSGDRFTVRERAVLAAMQMARFALLSPVFPSREVPLLWETSIHRSLGII